MIKKLKDIFKKTIPKKYHNIFREIKNILFNNYSTKTYSQEGEDMILWRLFGSQQTGFYVDVGAHHPLCFSKTYYFYKRGWCGINIDSMPESMKLFKTIRPRDINLEVAILDEKRTNKYFIFNEPALNTFSDELAKKRENENYKILEVKEVECLTLNEVLDRYLPSNQEIDFLSIDVEGMDFAVIRSVDLLKYTPKVILIEILGSKFKDILNHEITKYLINYNYVVFAKTFNTVFFLRKDMKI